MANIKISDLSPASTPLTGAEEVPMVQSGTTVKALVTDITEKTALQSVIDFNHNLVDAQNYQGTGAGVGNTGVNVNMFGTDAGVNNTGDACNFFGTGAGYNNTGDNVNVFGTDSGDGNTGNNCNFFGNSSGVNNAFNNVTIFGQSGAADDDNQMIFTTNAGLSAIIDMNDLTDDRKFILPDAAGTIALTSDIVSPYQVYSALISASGGTPTATVLKNTFGITFNLSNPSNGIIRITAATGSPFTNNKTWITSGGYNNGGQPYIVTSQRANLSPTTMVDFYFFLYDGTISATPNFANFSIEIRVYP